MAQDSVSSLGSRGSIVWAILLIAFGILAIALPLATSIGVVLLLAWLLVFGGAFQFIHAFRSHGAGSIAWKLLVAILYLGVGLYFLMHPVLGMASFTLLLAWFFVAEGVIDLVVYFGNRSAHGAGWILFNGIVTLILGVLVWRQWPNSSAWVIGTLVGISMIFTGNTRLMISLAARRLNKVGSSEGRLADRAA
jgi:uncharacterized membrane protein HdeD (DUF308 family)